MTNPITRLNAALEGRYAMIVSWARAGWPETFFEEAAVDPLELVQQP